MLNTFLRPRHINFWIALSVLVGITLRTVQYLGTSSMSFDELTSALNIQSKTFYELVALVAFSFSLYLNRFDS